MRGKRERRLAAAFGVAGCTSSTSSGRVARDRPVVDDRVEPVEVAVERDAVVESTLAVARSNTSRFAMPMKSATYSVAGSSKISLGRAELLERAAAA